LASTLWRKNRARDKKELFKDEPQPVPNSAYQLFVKERLQGKDSEKTPQKRMTALKSEWDGLSEKEKRQFEDKLQRLKEEYQEAYSVFVRDMNAQQVEEYSKKKGPKNGKTGVGVDGGGDGKRKHANKKEELELLSGVSSKS
jgi:hypothetical protein